jgi:hypothetical protein
MGNVEGNITEVQVGDPSLSYTGQIFLQEAARLRRNTDKVAYYKRRTLQAGQFMSVVKCVCHEQQ